MYFSLFLEEASLNITRLVAVLGGKSKLSCRINNNSTMEFDWWKDGKKIQTDKRLRYNEKRRFVIKQVQTSDGGLYTCKDRQGRHLTAVFLYFLGNSLLSSNFVLNLIL